MGPTVTSWTQNCQMLCSIAWMCMSGADQLVSAMVKGIKKRRSSANFGFKPGHQTNVGRVNQVSDTEHKPTKYLRLEFRTYMTW